MKITIPLRCEYFLSENLYDSFITEITELSNDKKLISLLDDSGNSIKNIQFEISENENNKSLFHIREIIHLSFIVDFLIIDIQFTNEELDTKESKFFVKELVSKFNLLINLSYSIVCDFLPGVVESNHEKTTFRIESITSNNFFVYNHIKKLNWPKIKSLKIRETVEYLYKNNIDLYSKSKNDLHRAINAFTYVFGDRKNGDSEDLFWVMLGIESLLVEGNQNITYQFKEKTKIILGEPSDFKKKINKLYDYRSRLVHGESEIFPKFNNNLDDAKDEHSDFVDFAISILISLIRELIYSNKIKFDFKIILI